MYMTGLNSSCQSCQKEFEITQGDLNFYQKLNVPPPVSCPECRLIRKMARRNERIFYKRKCDACKTDVISMYPQDSPFTIYCNKCWWSDNWNSLDYALDYNSRQSFFDQFYELSQKVPRLALYQKNAINSQYTNHSDHPKNCYLSVDVGFGEDLNYCKWVLDSKDILDSYGIRNSELCYESQDSNHCYNGIYLLYSESCVDSSFLFNCRGCKNCFLSSNLRNKTYYFLNKQLTKLEYEKKVAEINLGDYEVFSRTKKQFFEEVLPKTLRKFGIIEKAVNSTGDNLYECKNVCRSFHIVESEDSSYCMDSGNLKDCYDVYESAINCERQYESHACNRVSYSNFCSISYDDHHLEYSEMCHNSSDLFGSIGLRNKKYCILNKQYGESEYKDLKEVVVKDMTTKGEYGVFFPERISPFAYNETIAQEYFPLSEPEVKERGYSWRVREDKKYEGVMGSGDIPSSVDDVGDDILDKAIACSHGKKCDEQCTGAFKLIPYELQFYRRMKLPIPRLCPNCRHFARIRGRNPLKLWHRRCMCNMTNNQGQITGNRYKNTTPHFHGDEPCPNKFETSYSSSREEIIYCEQCYNSEVV